MSTKKKNSLFEILMHLVVVVVIYTVRVFMFAWFRPKVEWTGDTVKSAHLKTPSVIIANHTSMLDPIMMLAVFFAQVCAKAVMVHSGVPHFSLAQAGVLGTPSSLPSR